MRRRRAAGITRGGQINLFFQHEHTRSLQWIFPWFNLRDPGPQTFQTCIGNEGVLSAGRTGYKADRSDGPVNSERSGLPLFHASSPEGIEGICRRFAHLGDFSIRSGWATGRLIRHSPG